MYSYTTTGTYSLCVEVEFCPGSVHWVGSSVSVTVEAVGVGFRFRVRSGLVFLQIRVRVHSVELRYVGRRQRWVVCSGNISTTGGSYCRGVGSLRGSLSHWDVAAVFRGKWVNHAQVLCGGGWEGFWNEAHHQLGLCWLHHEIGAGFGSHVLESWNWNIRLVANRDATIADRVSLELQTKSKGSY